MKALMTSGRHANLRGFTIVEILVTVIVIGIIASVTIVAYNAVQASTRDSQRAQDVAIIKDALEQYWRKNGDYPANDQLNPNQQYPMLTDFTQTKALMPTLTDDVLTGPGGYSFNPSCNNSAWCINGSAYWKYVRQSYLYLSRFTDGSPGSYWWYKVPTSYDGNTGWGCDVQTYYSNPGYVIAWYKESTKTWVFERSQHGQVDIAVHDTTVAPLQPCVWDKS